MSTRAIASFVMLAVAPGAFAQEPAAAYPQKAVRVIVPFPAGGTADALPRIIAEQLAAKWGEPFVIENRSGAGGNIGAEAVWQAAPDGYTLLAAPPPPLVINHSLYPALAFDPTRFVPVTVIAAVPNALLVHPKITATNLREFIAFARAHPDRLNYASQGSGSTSHLAAEMFKAMAGVRLVHVPYKGTAPALADLLAGQVDIMFDNLGVSLQHVQAGKLKALAVGSERRFSKLPDVPAMSEVLPGFVSTAWYGIVAPPKTPLAIAQKLSAAIAETLKLPGVAARLAALSAEPIGSTPPEMAAFMATEAERYRRIIRTAGVKVD